MKIKFLPTTEATALQLLVFRMLVRVALVQLSGPAFCQALYSSPCSFNTVTQAPPTIGGKRSTAFDPQGIAVDAAGDICFADFRNHVIYRIAPSRAITIIAGKPGCPGSSDGPANDARFRYPHGLTVDAAGNIYVADSGNDTIRKITPGGIVTTLAGCARVEGSDDGSGSSARFKYPSGVAVDALGTVYVADMFNDTIRKITPAGKVTTFAGRPGKDGRTDGPGGSARFRYPRGIAVDRAGNIYIADTSNNTIRKATPDGAVTTLAGRASYVVGDADGTGGAAQFSHPSALAVDNEQNVYVADADNNTIRRITAAGTVTTLAGQARHSGYADGDGPAARFWHPVAIALDRTGNVYVADLDNAAIRKGMLAPFTNTDFSFTQPGAPGAGRNE